MNISPYKIFSTFRIPKSGIIGPSNEHGLLSTFSGDEECIFTKRRNRYWEDTTMPTILPRLYGHHSAHFTSQTLQYTHIPESTILTKHNMKAYPSHIPIWWFCNLTALISGWSLKISISVSYQGSLLHTKVWKPFHYTVNFLGILL